ncbi:MAG TPA: nuclear transport factor 2 family protein [Thermoanaerobaculia bacterium]|nr:nuclear transport factor 2 family protein [Thermoanaerobaculia bacterium]
MKRTIFSLFLGFFALSSFGAGFLSDEQSLRRLEREQALATYMGDATWFRAHTSDDYVLITGSGAVKTRAELIAELEKGVVMEPYEPAEVTVRAHGSTAIVSGRLLQKYTQKGERVTADLRFSDVWIKTDDGWYMISGQVSPLSIKSEPIKK